MVLLLQFTPVNCTKQGKSVLVLFIQFTSVNCEKTEGLLWPYLDSLHCQFLSVKFCFIFFYETAKTALKAFVLFQMFTRIRGIYNWKLLKTFTVSQSFNKSSVLKISKN